MNSGPGLISRLEPLLFVLGFKQEHCCLTYQETEQIVSQYHPNFGHLMGLYMLFVDLNWFI